jgi:hypothetical protein
MLLATQLGAQLSILTYLDYNDVSQVAVCDGGLTVRIWVRCSASSLPGFKDVCPLITVLGSFLPIL